MGFRPMKTLVVLPLPQPRWEVYQRPLPRPLLRDGPGLVVMTGRRWKSPPPLSSFNQGPPGILARPTALVGRGGRLRAAAPQRGGLQ